MLHLAEVGVDLELAIYACHAYLRNRAAERQVAGSQCARSGKAGESVGLDVSLGRNQPYIYKHLQVEIIGPEGADRTVDQTGNEDFIVRRATFSLEETAGETSG